MAKVASENPYESPHDETGDKSPVERSETKYEMLGRLVVRWEKLRLMFNAILILITLLFSLGSLFRNFTNVAFLELLASGAFVANLCYLVGPAIDGYLSWFGFRHVAVTIILFLIGTIFAVVIAIDALLYFEKTGMGI